MPHPNINPEEAGLTAALIANLSTAALDVKKNEGARHLVTPPGYQLHDITAAVEKSLPTPSRKAGTAHLKDVPSLLVYLKDQAATATAYVYANTDARSITAVFNDQRAGAGWRDHRASFRATFTPEFETWLKNDRVQKSQTEFAEFVEDNLTDLIGAEGTDLLKVATTMQAKTNIAFQSSKRLDNGQTVLSYTEAIDARAGEQGNLTIPKTFTLGVRIFKSDTDGFKLTARLKYRLNGSSVKFWYELERPERAIETAFNAYVAQLSESGYRVLQGVAD